MPETAHVTRVESVSRDFLKRSRLGWHFEYMPALKQGRVVRACWWVVHLYGPKPPVVVHLLRKQLS